MNADKKTPSLIDPLEDFLGYQLRRAAFGTMGVLLDAYADLGLSPTEAMVLRFAQANPRCTQAEIGRALGVKRTNMVPIVTRLMSSGLLERTPADGRSHSLYLTAKGVERHRRIAKLTLEFEQYFFADFPEKTRQILMQAFRSLRAKAEQRQASESSAGEHGDARRISQI